MGTKWEIIALEKKRSGLMEHMYRNCVLCPRRCGVDRTAGQSGYCRMPAGLRVARAAPHLWEEPVISGTAGSGAVFFSGCTMGCVFCQNETISHKGFGKDLTTARLREIFEDLIDQGCQNINLVTPTQFLPSILPALFPKLPVPVVYNCGGYESVETLKRLEGLVDIYLPDMKYADPVLSARYSFAPDYPEVAHKASCEMVRQTGPAVIENGIMKKGVIVRHLQLPGHLDNTLGVLDWFVDTFPKGQVLLSLMCQYVPMGSAKTMSPMDRSLTEVEVDAALSYAELLGIEQGFSQELIAATEDYVPAWDFEGL